MINVHKFPGSLSRSTRSRSALGFLINKYQECSEKHTGCRISTIPTAYCPSRLVDVGRSGESLIYLRDTQRLSDRGLYTCLSHCWGRKPPFLLTRSTNSKLQSGIPASILPKTFQDAIFVTRLLGIQFLWIDSLCIFQDSEADWSTEASQMGDIYRQAAFTIAATAAEDGDSGLFFDRDPALLQPRRIETTWVLHPGQEKFTYPLRGIYWCDMQELCSQAIEQAPLNSRAWVCQERHLSPRIMHFTDKRLLWECHEGIACENYPGGLPKFALPRWTDNPSVLRQDIHRLQLQQADMRLERLGHGERALNTVTLSDRCLYFSWAVFRIHYTRCAMTKEEDKLVAIQGIAQQLGGVLGDRLVAGLWRNRILEELCWMRITSNGDAPFRKPVKWRAPTWSWASIDATIWISYTTKFHYSCQKKQIWGEVIDLNIKTSISRELENASLKIRCKPIRAVVELYTHFDPTDNYLRGVVILQNSMEVIQALEYNKESLCIQRDEPRWEEKRHVQMIILQRCSHPSSICQDEDEKVDNQEISDCVEGLLLVPRQGSHDVFERVGLFTANSIPTVGKILEEHEAAESRIITLV